MKKTKPFYIVALIISFLVGIAFRIYHLFLIGFDIPFNLGGLFYQMSIEIIENDFLLPSSIPYYFPGGIPFAYPPLGFYIQAIIIKLFSPNQFLTVNILPPFFSILSLFGFFFLAQKLIPNKVGVVAALFTFSIIPVAFSEQIEAMGLAESIGTLFLILFILSLLWAIDKEQPHIWMMTGVLLGLCILSSPGSIYVSILISFLFTGFSIFRILTHKDFNFLIGCFIFGLVGLTVSFPYWYTIISSHGIDIFINTFKSQNSNLLSNFLQIALNMHFIKSSQFWNLLFLFGLLASLVKKYYSLLLLTILLILIPRENWVLSFTASLAIGIGIEYMLDLIQMIPKLNTNLLKVALIWILILFFMIDSIFTLRFKIDDDIYDISRSQIEDLKSINESNLIPTDQFVAVIGNWGLIEWSPTLLKRIVINNPFGLEWLPGQSEKIFLLSENLLNSTSIEMILDTIREDFNGVTTIYIIADHSYLEKLNPLIKGNKSSYRMLQDYREFGLFLITSEK